MGVLLLAAAGFLLFYFLYIRKRFRAVAPEPTAAAELVIDTAAVPLGAQVAPPLKSNHASHLQQSPVVSLLFW